METGATFPLILKHFCPADWCFGTAFLDWHVDGIELSWVPWGVFVEIFGYSDTLLARFGDDCGIIEAVEEGEG